MANTTSFSSFPHFLLIKVDDNGNFIGTIEGDPEKVKVALFQALSSNKKLRELVAGVLSQVLSGNVTWRKPLKENPKFYNGDLT